MDEDELICESVLIESAADRGVCERGRACAAESLRDDYKAFRRAHRRVVVDWRSAEG
jgi:hypothetical protein